MIKLPKWFYHIMINKDTFWSLLDLAYWELIMWRLIIWKFINSCRCSNKIDACIQNLHVDFIGVIEASWLNIIISISNFVMKSFSFAKEIKKEKDMYFQCRSHKYREDSIYLVSYF